MQCLVSNRHSWTCLTGQEIREQLVKTPSLVNCLPSFIQTSCFAGTWSQILPSVGASLMAQTVKKLPAIQETQIQPLSQEDPLEKKMATHSSILAWRIPWTEEPGGLLSHFHFSPVWASYSQLGPPALGGPHRCLMNGLLMSEDWRTMPSVHLHCEYTKTCRPEAPSQNIHYFTSSLPPRTFPQT